MSAPIEKRIGTQAALLAGVSARALGWRPDDFWSATPAELAAALIPPAPEAPLGRAELERLMETDDAR